MHPWDETILAPFIYLRQLKYAENSIEQSQDKRNNTT